MKTSVIEVHDMLSVWSAEEVEKRLGEVPGVASATVNFAAGSAAVRYDETRLAVADIKSVVRQRGFEATTTDADSAPDGHEGHADRARHPRPRRRRRAPLHRRRAPLHRRQTPLHRRPRLKTSHKTRPVNQQHPSRRRP